MSSKQYAQVAMDVAIGKELDYAVPESLRDSLEIGARVWAPLGSGTQPGYVVSFSDKPSFEPVKEIAGLVAGDFSLSPQLMELARWVADYYCAPLGLTLRSIVPSSVRHPGAHFREVLYVKRGRTIAETRDACIHLRTKSAKQAAVLEVLLTAGKDIPLQRLCEQAGCTRAAVNALVKMGLAKIEKRKVERLTLKEDIYLPSPAKELNSEQKAIFDAIRKDIDAGIHATHLIQGVTASGKTEIYLQAMAYALALGKSSIMLVPEISLTPQTIERVRSRFGDQVAILHHRLSGGERHDQWHKICTGKAKIAVGARSAVFAPSPNLGLIVVDEEHDPSYKQSELSPMYHARDVAVYRGRNEDAVVVLGSATPSLESFRNAANGFYRLGCLTKRVDDRSLPRMMIVDMRREAEKQKRYPIFSDILLNAIGKRLEKSEQVMLFLNRRGYSTALNCRSCGKVLECEHCSVPMKYHRDEEKLLCHLCGHTMAVTSTCPFCKQSTLAYHGVGTQKVERALKKIFPQVRVLRMDYDTTRQKDSHFSILRDFKVGKGDVLLGTQMISKGLHFENVTLVGIISADTSLHVNDFRSGERTFQHIMQVAGRAGRGEVAGEVIIQTFQPHHEAIQAAERYDNDLFYQEELRQREELRYPPAGHLVAVNFTGKDEKKVEATASQTVKALSGRLPESAEVLGPAPARISRAKKIYRYRAVVKCPDVEVATGAYRDTLKVMKIPHGVKVGIDVDPISID